MRIDIIHRKNRIAVLEDGSEVPITSFLDSDGDECENERAVVAVAGPDRNGQWWSINLSEFSPASTH